MLLSALRWPVELWDLSYCVNKNAMCIFRVFQSLPCFWRVHPSLELHHLLCRILPCFPNGDHLTEPWASRPSRPTRLPWRSGCRWKGPPSDGMWYPQRHPRHQKVQQRSLGETTCPWGGRVQPMGEVRWEETKCTDEPSFSLLCITLSWVCDFPTYTHSQSHTPRNTPAHKPTASLPALSEVAASAVTRGPCFPCFLLSYFPFIYTLNLETPK